MKGTLRLFVIQSLYHTFYNHDRLLVNMVKLEKVNDQNPPLQRTAGMVAGTRFCHNNERFGCSPNCVYLINPFSLSLYISSPFRASCT